MGSQRVGPGWETEHIHTHNTHRQKILEKGKKLQRERKKINNNINTILSNTMSLKTYIPKYRNKCSPENNNTRASLVAQMVKNLPAMQETWVWSLGWEDPLEESLMTHSSILAWRIPMDRVDWQATSMGSDTTEWLSTMKIFNNQIV